MTDIMLKHPIQKCILIKFIWNDHSNSFSLRLFIQLKQQSNHIVSVMQFYDPYSIQYFYYLQQMAYNSQINSNISCFNDYYGQTSYINLDERAQLPRTQENTTQKLNNHMIKSEPKDQSFQIEKQRAVTKSQKSQRFRSKGHLKTKKSVQNAQVQKQGRNSNSNLLRMFFRTLENRSEAFFLKLCRIIEKHSLGLKVEDFIQWIQKNKVDHKNYIRICSVKKVFIGHPKQVNYTFVMRILFQNFLNNDSIASYLTSKKIKKSSYQERKCNYRVIRQIFKEIYSLPNEF